MAVGEQPELLEASAKRRVVLSGIWRFVSGAIWCGVLVLSLLVVVVTGVVTGEHFLGSGSLDMLVRQWAMLAVLVPAAVMIVAAGGLDLSVGGVAALSAVVIGVVSERLGLGVGAGIIAALVAALIVGTVNGLVVGLGRVHGAIATLGTMALARGLAHLLSGGEMIFVGGRHIEWLSSPVVAAALLLVSLVVGCLLVHLTPFPRRDDSHRGLGLRILFVGVPYILSSLAAAVVGTMSVATMRAAGPTIGQGLEVDVLFAVVVGGTVYRSGYGNAAGAFLAALIVVCGSTLLIMAGVTMAWRMVLEGGVLVLAAVIVVVYYLAVSGLFRKRVLAAQGT